MVVTDMGWVGYDFGNFPLSARFCLGRWGLCGIGWVKAVEHP